MAATETEIRPFDPATPEQQQAVRAQLERLLHSSHFRNSRRYPTLLRHIVEETLEGHGQQLKERTLGVEVFGRAPDYDTSADPIVRVTIAEIRKRIAQYYHEEGHNSELRIELNPGSYIPEFFQLRTEPVEHVETPAPAESTAAHPVEEPAPAADRRRVRWWHRRMVWVTVAAVSIAAISGAALWRWRHPSPLDMVWGPLFAQPGPITYCIPMSAKKKGLGQANTTAQAIAHVYDLAEQDVPDTGTFLDHQSLGENVVYSDVLATLKLESVVEQQHRPVRLRVNLGTTLNDLREGPVVLVGGLDNQWTLKTLDPLRYRFAGSDADRYYIRDAKQPDNKQWSVKLTEKYEAVDRDYAIIARVHSQDFGQPVMVAAGVGMSGTAAAGEFLADPAQAAELRKWLGPGMKDHDFEVVLQSDVVNGMAGPPHIVAAELF